MPRAHRIPTDRLATLHGKGLTFAEIAERTGLSLSQVSRRLRAAGYAAHPAQTDTRVRIAQRTFETQADACPRTVAEVCGIHLATAYKARKRAAIAKRHAAL